MAVDRLRYEERVPSSVMVRAIVSSRSAVRIACELSEEVNVGRTREVVDGRYLQEYFEQHNIYLQVGGHVPTVDLTKGIGAMEGSP